MSSTAAGTSAVAPDQQRFAALDGLRGWAALSVVIYHCLWQTFGVRFPELHNFITALLGNGILAVAIFLTISGYVLTRRRWRNPHNPPLLVAAVRRYVRLTIPIIAATALVFVLMAFELTPTRPAHEVTGVRAWYNTFVRFEPGVLDAISFAFAWTYTWPVAHNYNPFLWTMLAELWGCWVLFALSQNDRYLREPYSPLLLLTVLTLLMFPLGACFGAGALIALAERDGALPASSTPLLSFVASCGLLALLAVAAFTQLLDGGNRFLAVLGTATFLAVRYSLPAQRFLNTGISQFLGHISFPLYLVQFAVIVSHSANLIVWVHTAAALTTSTALLIAAGSVVASLVLATLFLPIELGTLALLRRFNARRVPRVSVAARAV
ncbi:MAG: acyltransferase [Devosia sp.]